MKAEAPARKLAAILHADVVGYSRMMGEDELGTHRLIRHYRELISAKISQYRGRVVDCAGDSVLAEFTTATDALAGAVDIQDEIAVHDRETNDAARQTIQYRIGLHLGEVLTDGDSISGDSVNIAVRLEGLAEPGGICISESVRSAVGAKLPFAYEFLGGHDLKNIRELTRAYRVVTVKKNREIVPPCPYPGMVPYGMGDAQHFYGRADEIARMIQLLRRQRFMMVIGPSGSGKSSLIHAGLLPALKKSRYFDPDHWLIRTMRPGPSPWETLSEIVLDSDGNDDIDANAIETLLQSKPSAQQLLIVIDQFEEVFTQAARNERSRFVSAVLAMRQLENCALVLTLRADFYPELMTSALWPIDVNQRVEVAPLRGDALRDAIQRPAADVGVRIENRLLAQLLDDAAEEPGALPLLQETMGLLWDDTENRLLPYSAYEHLKEMAGQTKSGLSGLAVAIAMKADATLAQLNENQQAIARRIFLRLIQFGEGRADTRRQQSLTSLNSANDAPDEFERTLEHLTHHRLLTRSGARDHHPPKVDIAHESLIRGWSRLQDWADERRDAEQVRRRLESKALEWVRLGKKSGGLLDKTELPEAERWLAGDDARDLGFDQTLLQLVNASKRSARRKRIGVAAGLLPVLSLLAFIIWTSAEGSYPITALQVIAARLGFDTLVKPEMVEIPEGSFMMGSHPDDEGAQPFEFPRHEVVVPAFAMSKFEVTFVEWDICFNAGGCSHLPADQGWGRGRRPVINVSWDDVQEYVGWLSSMTGEDYRLPSEAEWEYAARAGLTTRYATGGELTAAMANFGVKDGQTVDVGSFPPNEFGLHDVHGNAMEWVQDRYSETYNEAPSDGSAWEDDLDTLQRVLRGGSWGVLIEDPRIAWRLGKAENSRNDDFGFRIAKSLQ